MMLFVVTAIALMTIVGAMSIGVIMGRKPISGSCGGVGAALGEDNYSCEICGGDPARCDESAGTRQEAARLGYNAAK